MNKQPYKRLSVDFPTDEYIFLKMACAKQGVSLKDFVTNAVMKSIDEYEAQLDSLSLQDLTEEEIKNAIPLEQVEKELGWDKI